MLRTCRLPGSTTTLVLLKEFCGRMPRISSTCFNSTLVLLKDDGHDLPVAGHLSFNSTLVLLKEFVKEQLVERVDLFQFHVGAIEGDRVLAQC